MAKLGSKIGLDRYATIIKYNGDGTVRVALDEGNLIGSANEFNTPIPAAWTGPDGEFIGGYPITGSSVVVSQGQGGQWFITGYVNSNDVFDRSFISSENTKMSSLKPGRALIQVKNDIKIFADPGLGIQFGDAISFVHANPNRKILSHNFNEEFSFTESGFRLHQIIKRDIVENSTNNILNSKLTSQSYEDSLFKIGLDPSIKVSIRNSGDFIRNPALVENRELINEFGQSFNYKTDREESFSYTDNNDLDKKIIVNKKEMRSDLLSLSLEHPNHLIETIKGTVVDAVGNILDINRTILPIGKSESLSLRKNVDKSDAFNRIRAISRKSIAYHFEINSRKGDSESNFFQPDVNDKSNYARDRSKFSIDIDKEGQFKINIPASSETGNIPLLTRYENYSNLLAKEDDTVNPNSFVRNEEKKDIFLEGFGISNISLIPSGEISEYNYALDRFSDEPIKLGTAYHDITNVLSEFQESAGFRQVNLNLVQFDSEHPLNNVDIPYDKIVSSEIIVTGPEANAGGRSGTISLDGMISINLGANTVDRQSMWFDSAGSIISRVGRDKQGISYASSLDGDLLIQVGGVGIGNSFDSRFLDQNDAYRNGKVDIRVLVNGQTIIFRLDETGVNIVSPGRMTFWSQQDMIFNTKSNLKFIGENIIMHADSSKRIVQRFPDNSI